MPDPTISRAIATALIAMIGEASEDFYAAGWMGGIEFEAWDFVTKGAASDFAYLDLGVDDLRTLARLAGGWVHWGRTEDGSRPAGDGPVFVPMAEWERLYAAWVERRLTPWIPACPPSM